MQCIEIKLSIGLDPSLSSLVQEGFNTLHRVSCADKSVLDRIERILQQILSKENIMSQELDALIAEVARNTTVEKSALAAIQGLSAKLTEAGNDPAKLAKLRADLAANDDELAAAVAANTPVATPPVA
jgi:septation ring formation regulator EzrA